MGDVLLEIKATFSGHGTEQDIIARYTGTPLLVIDDLGKEKPTEWALSTIFNIVDGRYRKGKPTIYTTQYNGKQLAERLASGGNPETAEAIVSRMQGCKVVVLDGEDRRTQQRLKK